MATGFPAATGDVLTSGMFNGLTSFTVGAANTDDYTAVLSDQYQVLELMNKATAVAFPVGTALTVLNIGAGTCTISAVTSGTTTVLSGGAVAASPTLAQYKSAVCLKTAANTWYVVGAIA